MFNAGLVNFLWCIIVCFPLKLKDNMAYDDIHIYVFPVSAATPGVFDHIVVNDKVDAAYEEMAAIVEKVG